MYTVIYSKSPYLLARMATDLQMGGMKLNDWRFEETNGAIDYYHPLSEENISMAINHPEFPLLNSISFWCGNLDGYTTYPHITHTLTSRNYLKVLGAILNSKK